MQAFSFATVAGLESAAAAARIAGTKYIAGGTDLLQLTKDEVETPRRLIDLETLPLSRIEVTPSALRLGAMARMSDVAADPTVQEKCPVLAEALLASASPQIRNMGTMGGNLLQRTRCGYFRDIGFACNKRDPGSSCPAIRGENRMHAILGGSDHCIATHASDMAVALVALDASVELVSAEGGRRTVKVESLHLLPGSTPEQETVLTPGELITAISVPIGPEAQRSHYLKVRDRASFEFAVVSAAVALQVDGGAVRAVRIAAGGVGTKPWRLPEVERALLGQPVSEQTLRAASELAGVGARTSPQNAFKLTLLRRTVFRALRTVAA